MEETAIVTRRLRITAIAGFASLAAAVPGDAAAARQIVEAQTALRSGRYESAVTQYSRLVEQEPGSVSAARGLVRTLSEIGRYQDAVEVAQEFGWRNHGSVELANSLGEVLFSIGRVQEAETAFRNAVTASDSLTARFNLAVLQYSRGEVDVAMSEFDRFIDLYNRNRNLSSEQLTLVAAAVRYLGVRDAQIYRDALRANDEAIAADPNNLEPRVQVADLFLQKYEGAEALAGFEEVLKLNPNHPDALLGLARTRRFNGVPDVMEPVRRSLEVNENLVAARVFLATLYLESEDYAAATEELDRALALNPASLEALAVRAATRFLQLDRRGFDQAVRQVLSHNPRYGELFNILAEVSARNRLYEQAVDFAARAIELDPQSWRGYALLGINQLRNGAMSEGRANLERAFAGDPYDVWTKNTLDLLDALETYVVVPSERFEFVIDGKESDLLALYLNRLGDEAYQRMHQRYGHRPETPIRVELFPNHADFSVRTVGLVGLGALGVSFGPVVAMDSPSARELGEFNWGATFWHELAHTFHMSMSDHRVPRWFTEGLAVLEERRARSGWGRGVSLGFLAAYRQGKLLPVSKLNDGFMRPTYPEQVGFSYYQASLVCELIEEEHGLDALVGMLRGYGEGRSTAELFGTVVGVDLERFDEMFDEYLADRFAGSLRAISAGEREGVSPHASRDEIALRARNAPGDFVAQLAMGQILVGEGRGREAVPYLERAKALFPEYAEADSPYWHLAQVYQEQGELERAESELTSLTMHNERHYRAYTRLAEVRETLHDSAGAAAALEAALFVYPMDAAVHLKLAELYAGIERWQAAIRERRAVLALDPVDRAEALYQLAKVHYDSGDISEARRVVLQALERAPNFERAQILLLEIHSRNEEIRR